MRTRVSILLSVFTIAMAIQLITSNASHLKEGYYKNPNRCPDAEEIVYTVVYDYLVTQKNPGLGAGLIRLFFHDCFVRGSDASILLDQSNSNPIPEKSAGPNKSLRGFEIIDTAKAELEKNCTGIVSCADILAFAARDAAYILGNIFYEVPSGRYDGRISNINEVSLPGPSFNITQLIKAYKDKGLSLDDLVLLSAAHSIGQSHCSSFTKRLYPKIDPTLDETFAKDQLMGLCPQNATVNGVVPLDFVTKDVLDTQYYDNVESRRGLFFSDWSLLNSAETAKLVEKYRASPELFRKDFGASMVNMGNIGVLDKKDGEIRLSCSAVNY